MTVSFRDASTIRAHLNASPMQIAILVECMEQETVERDAMLQALDIHSYSGSCTWGAFEVQLCRLNKKLPGQCRVRPIMRREGEFSKGRSGRHPTIGFRLEGREHIDAILQRSAA